MPVADLPSLFARVLGDGAIAVPGAARDSWLALVEGDEAHADALRARLHQLAPDVASMTGWFCVERLPRCGRVQLAELARRLRAASTLPELLVAGAWCDARGVAPSSIDEDFFAAGGHSLLAAEVASQLESVVGFAVPLAMMFDHSTVRDQAAWLARSAPRQPARARVPAPVPVRVIALRGLLDRAALDRAFVRVGQRFAVPDRVTRDLSACAGAVRRAGWRAMLDELARFAPGSPAWRAALVQLAPQRHLLALAFAPARLDASSARIVCGELAEAYRAAVADRAPLWPPATALAWPPEPGAGAPGAIGPDAGHSDPDARVAAAVRLTGRCAGALVELARHQRATTEASLLAALAVLAGQRAGKAEVVIGIPGSRRIDPATRTAIGPLDCLAPVAISLAGDPSFHALIERAALAHRRGLAIGAGLAAGALATDELDALLDLDEHHDDADRSRGAGLTWRAAAFARRVERRGPSVVHLIAAASAAGVPLIRVTAPPAPDASATAAALAGELERLIGALVARPGVAISSIAGLAGPGGTAPPPAEAPATVLPLSHAQERLWFVESLSPGTTVNHVQRVYRIQGPLDPGVLERAIAAVAARHDVLRTALRVVDGAPRQIVSRAVATDHASEAIVLGDPGERTREVGRRAQADYERTFDLARGPLWRTRLCSIAPDDHSLIFTAHHIIIDAVSIHVWLRELSEHYRALASGTRPRVPDLAASVGDLARWERSPEGRAVIADDLQFWVDELAGAGSLELPLDAKRPTTPTVGRHHVSTLVPPDRVAELRATARRHGATLNTALIAAAFAFLSRLTGQLDLVCVVPAANRDDPKRARLIGLLLNLLPLRLRLAGDPTFGEIIGRTDRAMRAALRHSYAPFERIVAGAGVAREPGRQPLFDITLNMAPSIDWFRCGGLRYAQESVKNTAQPCDMVISASTKRGGLLDLVIRCREDLFAAATAERMVKRFATLLLAGAASPDLRLSQLPVLPDDERALVVESWNRTAMALPDTTVHALVSEQLRRASHAVAVRQGGRAMTGGELEHRADRLARRLRARALPAGTPIGVAIPPSPELAVAALGVMKAGMTYVPFDAAHPPARLAMLAREVAFVVEPGELAAGEPGEPGGPPDERSPDAPSYIVFTSGSTGQPKTVSTSHRALVNQILWFRRDLPWLPGEVACLRSSPAFADSLWEIFGPLADGVPLAIATSGEMHEPHRLAAMIARERVTRLVVVPSLLHALLELGASEAELPDIALWLSTSEELKPALVRRFFAVRPRSRLVNLYGCSETGAEVSAFEVTAADPVRTPIGTPIANTRIYVLGGAGQPQPIGVYGELYVGGAGVSEYRNAPPGPERFPADPFSPGARMYRTGDRGRWRHDGNLEYVGRLDHVLKIRGVRIDPGEVENAILGHPDVAAVVVTAAAGGDGEPRLVAYLVARARIDHAELRRFLRARLPETMIPTALVALDELPLGPTGKLDRAQLPPPSFSGAASRPPHGLVEHAVALVWEQLLDRALGAEDDFFAAGGQSLLAAQLGARLAERFGVELPLPALFERPTIAAQAAWIEDATRAAGDTGILRVAADRPAPLSFAQERMWFAAALAPRALQPRLRYVLRLAGPLDAGRLDAAMLRVAERQNALRTVFTDGAAGVQQRVAASCPRDHVFDDARAPSEHDAVIRAHLTADRERAFDLAAGPPWRTRLIRLADQLHVLVVTFHHLVADGISIQLWLEEVDEHYRALAGTPAVAPVAVSAADVAIWQRHMVDSPAWNPSRAFWRHALAGAAAIDLPSVAPRTDWSSAAAGRVRADLSADQAQAIAQHALGEQTTVFGFLVAAANALVHQLTERTDLTLGTISAGRDRRELRPLIGLFLNPLPLRSDVSGDPELRELVRRAGAMLRATLAHSELPFERIVAEVNPERRPYRQPLFDFVINYHPPASPPRLGELAVSHVRGLAAPVSPYELMLRAISHPRGLTLQLDFQRDRFVEADVRGWLDRYVALLRLMLAEPERRLSRCWP